MSAKDSAYHSHEEAKGRQIKVAVIGAGIAGLAVANGLLKDPAGRFDVQVYERDTIAFDSERGGYQLRISGNGLNALKTVSDDELWGLLRNAWAGDNASAPTLVDPDVFGVHLRLADLKLYPASRPIPRHGLRRALLQPLLARERVHLSHRFARFDYLSEGGIQLYFKDQEARFADIVIAADGSNSTINKLVGLNNKIKLEEWTLIQARATVSSSVREQLPRSVTESGSVLFLGGLKVSGFVSIYDPQKEFRTAGTDVYTLFWSILVPSARGKVMLEKAGGEPQKIVPLLVDYLRELGLGESLPFIIQSATEHLRVGLLTSSVKPTTDWRLGNPRAARIILLGDAVHPMTPGRGMGANQALTDAANLVKAFHAADFDQAVPSDQELTEMVTRFDREMYERAFKMVKASQAVTDLDLTTWKGRATLAVIGVLVTIAGWAASGLELLGLWSPEKLDYMSRT